MSRIRHTLFFILLPLMVMAQQDLYLKNVNARQKDSLRHEFQTTQSDTAKMHAARSLGFYYQEVFRDSALYFHDAQLKIARKLKMNLWQVDALQQGGWVLSELKNYPLSLSYFLEANKILSEPNRETDDFYLATFFNGRDPKIVRQIIKGFLHNDFSQLYDATGDVPQKMSHLYKGLKIGKELQYHPILSLIALNLSDAHFKESKIDSALIYSLNAINHMEKANYRTYYGEAHSDVGNAYLKLGRHNLAKKYFDKSVILNIRDNNPVKLSNSYYTLGEYFLATNRPDSAAKFFNKAGKNYKRMGELAQLNDTYTALYLLYKKESMTDSASFYVELSKNLGDSLYQADRKKIFEYQNIAFSDQIKRQAAEQNRIDKANRFKMYAMLAAIAIFLFVMFLLYRNVRNRKKANDQLQLQKEKIQHTLEELKATQSQLIQSEKMASLGELTAGIAHEIQNPLNFVNNFSDVSNEMIIEVLDERSKGQEARDESLIDETLKDVKENLEKINHHGKRADSIVKGMLQHSASTGKKEAIDINALVDEYLRLAYHRLRAKDQSFNAELITEFDKNLPKANVVPQDIGRVLLNLLTNAFHATQERKRSDESYKPIVEVQTSVVGNSIEIKVKDNGNGIAENIKDKIFQPFFTTKPTGQGTGLGLSLAYDIVKAHGGELKVHSEESEGTIFTIVLPL